MAAESAPALLRDPKLNESASEGKEGGCSQARAKRFAEFAAVLIQVFGSDTGPPSSGPNPAGLPDGRGDQPLAHGPPHRLNVSPSCGTPVQCGRSAHG